MAQADRIRYEVKINFLDSLASQFIGFWLYRRCRICLALQLPLGISLVILVAVGHVCAAACVLCYFLGMWSLVLLRGLAIAIDEKKDDIVQTTLLDEEKGLGFETKGSSGWMGWNEFRYIRETKQFFFLQYRTGFLCVIFKRTLPNETITAIREMLVKVPVERKFLK